MSSSSFELDAEGIYRCTAFSEYPWQRHGFGTRTGNPRVDITLRQIHSNTVRNVYDANGLLRDHESQGDALVANRIGCAVGVRTADCVPILLLDPKTRAVAAVHAGWRGTAAGISRAVIEKMTADFGSDPGDLLAAIGPCIRPCCYEVGVDVASQFSSYFPEQAAADVNRMLDLAEVNRRQLLQCGMLRARISDIGLCTACDDKQFFSYRREPTDPGRMISVIERIE